MALIVFASVSDDIAHARELAVVAHFHDDLAEFVRLGEAAQGAHVAFSAPNRAAVDRFHAAGLKTGGRDNGKPGLRADYSPSYYAAFLIDPDGNNVEAVCMEAA